MPQIAKPVPLPAHWHSTATTKAEFKPLVDEADLEGWRPIDFAPRDGSWIEIKMPEPYSFPPWTEIAHWSDQIPNCDGTGTFHTYHQKAWMCLNKRTFVDSDYGWRLKWRPLRRPPLSLMTDADSPYVETRKIPRKPLTGQQKIDRLSNWALVFFAIGMGGLFALIIQGIIASLR